MTNSTFPHLTMAYDEWLEAYRPVTNALTKSAPFDGLMFETFGPELAHVRDTPADRVWTLVEGDDDTLYVLSGFHFVNRLGYFIAAQPRPPHVDIEVPVD
ncbi:hypothetical protein [Minwuia thermotolerans]|nr:hypothetical protein [Minwuia thermotolerans]